MKQQFQAFRFRRDTLTMIDQANKIIDEYQQQGFQLTLRQLYYQFVSRDLLENTNQKYKQLGSVISDARMAGLIDWNAIEDRTRNVRSVGHWNSPADILRSAHDSFAIDKWRDQQSRVEVWIEKDALSGVIERVCRDNDVSCFAYRGYVSQSEMYSAAQRLGYYIERYDQKFTILHLGDHDPSGIDMTRDIKDRLNLFLEPEKNGYHWRVEVKRIALNWNQINEYNPPPNPAKNTDSRFTAYEREYGDESWELDALEPTVINDLIENEIDRIRDGDLWDAAVKEEETHRKQLRKAAVYWNEVASFLDTK